MTAQRRAQSLQKTALSVVVLQPGALVAAGVTNAQQLTAVVPSLQIGNGGPAPSVYLRGVGGYAAGPVSNPAIPFYTDGVYVAASPSLASEFYDVERLEVLKGPQGTLYGRNASGGAINVITVNPRLGYTGGFVEAEVGNYGNQNGEAAINLPLGTTAALRLSSQIVDKGGYSSIGLGTDVHHGARAKILWQPDSNVSLLLNGSYGHIGGLSQAFVMLDRDVPGWYPWLDSADPRAIAFALANAAFPPNALFPGSPGAVDPPTKADAGQKLSFYNISAKLDWNFGPVALTVVPAYRYARDQHHALFTFLVSDGYGLGDQPISPNTSRATSLEVRLSGNSERLKWVAGLYYYDEDQFQQATVYYSPYINVGSLGTFGTRSYAAFGQATASLTDHVRLIAGARYTTDRRTIDGQTSFLAPSIILGPALAVGADCTLPVPIKAVCVADEFAGRHTFHNFSWKAGFEADVLGDGLLYGTVSRGFKAGGFNLQSEFGNPGEPVLFNPEILTAYELGLKNRYFNNRLQLNLSAFYWDYKGHQEPRIDFTNAGTLNLIYFNAGSTKIYGGTIEMVARPWRHGTLNASVEYAHSKYNDFIFQVPSANFNPASTACTSTNLTPAPFTRVDCSGFESVRTPKWSGNVGYQHEIPLPSGSLIATGDMTFASARWLAIEFTPIQRAKAYATFDASLTYRAPGDRWSLGLFGRNLTNATVYTQAVTSGLTRANTSHINPPRSYGARLSVKF